MDNAISHKKARDVDYSKMNPKMAWADEVQAHQIDADTVGVVLPAGTYIVGDANMLSRYSDMGCSLHAGVRGESAQGYSWAYVYGAVHDDQGFRATDGDTWEMNSGGVFVIPVDVLSDEFLADFLDGFGNAEALRGYTAFERAWDREFVVGWNAKLGARVIDDVLVFDHSRDYRAYVDANA